MPSIIMDASELITHPLAHGISNKSNGTRTMMINPLYTGGSPNRNLFIDRSNEPENNNIFSTRPMEKNQKVSATGITHDCAETAFSDSNGTRGPLHDSINNNTPIGNAMDRLNDEPSFAQRMADIETPAYSSSPHKKLLSSYDLKIADPAVYAQDAKRRTGTPALLQKRFAVLFPDAQEQLERGLRARGPLAAAAIGDYRDTFELAFESPQYCTVFAALIAAIATDDQRSEYLDTLICVAVNMESAVSMLDLAEGVKRTGRFDRSKSYSGPLEQSPSYRMFDHNQNNDADSWWWALGHLVITWWGWNPSSSGDQVKAKAGWTATMSGGSFEQSAHGPMEGLIARGEKLHRIWKDAAYGKQVCTDHQRIENLLHATGQGLQRHLRERLSHKDKQVHHLEWNEFLVGLEAAGCAWAELNIDMLDSAGIKIPNVGWAPVGRDMSNPNPRAQADRVQAQGALLLANKGKEPCWNWSHQGVCNYNPCKYLHIGEPGAQKHTVCDKDGFCLKGNDCKRHARGMCSFKHRVASTRVAATPATAVKNTDVYTEATTDSDDETNAMFRRVRHF